MLWALGALTIVIFIHDLFDINTVLYAHNNHAELTNTALRPGPILYKDVVLPVQEFPL